MIFSLIWLQISPDVFSGVYNFHFTVINLFSICFQLFYSRDLDRMKEILSPHPNSTRVGATREWRSVASQYFSTNIDSLAFFIALFYLWKFSWRFYNAAWIFQNQFRKFWFHILSRATLPYLELSKCQIENRAPSDQNILSHFYWKNISSLLC